MTRFLRTASALSLVLAMVAVSGCERYPRDPERSLERAIERGTLRVGLSEARPWVTSDGDFPGGVEVALIEGFARELGVEPEWRWGSLEEHVLALERFELDVVAGGVTKENPWTKRVAPTRPYYEKHLLMVPPGENALLVRLERHLLRPRAEIEEMLSPEAAP